MKRNIIDSGPTRVRPCGRLPEEYWGLAKMNELRMTDGKLRTCCGEMLINGVCHFAHSPAHLDTTEASIYLRLSLELLPGRYEWRRRPSLSGSSRAYAPPGTKLCKEKAFMSETPSEDEPARAGQVGVIRVGEPYEKRPFADDARGDRKYGPSGCLIINQSFINFGFIHYSSSNLAIWQSTSGCSMVMVGHRIWVSGRVLTRGHSH